VASLFLALATLLAAARLAGALARRLGQPAVIGEILAGIALGPTVLPAATSHAVVPDSARPLLAGLAAVGLASFVFVVGHEMATSFGPRGGRTAAGVAVGSVVLPLAGGCLLALSFAAAYGPAGQLQFVAFVGVAMAATAFPVLARILTDRRLDIEPIGRLAMAAAAVTDVVIWVLLAGVVTLAGTGRPWRVALVPVFLLLLVYGMRPALARTLRGRGEVGPGDAVVVPLLLVGLMLSCAATEWMGVHYVCGAFAFGAVVGRAAPLPVRSGVVRRMQSVGADVLLPVYFVLAGMQVDLSDVGTGLLGVLAAVLAVAVGTKTAGAYVGGRLTGLPRDAALTLAVLMNTRGLTEIVVLTVGLKLGLIDDRFYSAMVVMAVVTTAMTGPLLNLLTRRQADRTPRRRSRPVPTGERTRP
jgi:Kef-type K+ transport system membrane component KefB